MHVQEEVLSSQMAPVDSLTRGSPGYIQGISVDYKWLLHTSHQNGLPNGLPEAIWRCQLKRIDGVGQCQPWFDVKGGSVTFGINIIVGGRCKEVLWGTGCVEGCFG
jgi:hypothetical protein